MVTARRIGRGLAAAGLLIGCQACTDGGQTELTPSPTDVATVSGVLLIVGGPPPGSPRPERGTVILESATDSKTAETDDLGRFTIVVAAGDYRAIGKIGDGVACPAEETVTARPGATVAIQVVCHVP